ncbi:hypothetical protein JCM33374_g4548 [Metschnikowia sp. JCM 33374]|nr:hypothetical protein JCM33374_g4548 [Metschnikowia sp. JCM 33374]
MSLQEFFSDESYGGSWADEEIDIASISVPIEKNKGYAYGDSHYGSGGGGFGAGSGFSKSAFIDNGPPYIVKLSNIPVTSNDAFISDLFHSRFTPLVKFKILFDPFSQPLESGIVKKIAFVELPSFASQNKVSKWQDVVYKGSRRVNIEVADFNDFQQSMRFNQENHEELLRVETTFLSSRPRLGHPDEPGAGRGRPGFGRSPGGMPLDNIPLSGSHHRFGPQLQARKLSNGSSPHPNLSSAPAVDNAPPLNAVPKPKPNPFGSAKPVDVMARQHEIERNLITSKHTIVRAPWADENISNGNPHPQNSSDTKSPWGQANGPKKSLADILSSTKASNSTKNPRATTANSTPKPIAKKPTVLMKKAFLQTPEPQETPQKDNTKTDSITTKLSEVSINPEGKGESPIADTDNGTVAENKDTSDLESPAPKKEHFNAEDVGPVKANPRPDFKKSLNEITQKSEGKRMGNKKRVGNLPDHFVAPQAEDVPPKSTLPERKPRRLSNKSKESLTRPRISTRTPRHERESDTKKQVEEKHPNDTRKIKRESNSGSRQSADQLLDPKNAVNSSPASNEGCPIKASPNMFSGSQHSDVPSTESEPIKQGDHQGRGRGRGNGHSRGRGRGRGNGKGDGRRSFSRSGKSGSEVRRKEGKERNVEGGREGDGQNHAVTENKESHKSS